MKFMRCIYPLVVFVLAFSGCVPTSSTIAPTLTKTLPPSPNYVLPTATMNIAPQETATFTPYVTLAPDQAKNAITTLVVDSNDCNAPCLWGIIPGQTTLDEAQSMFARLALQFGYTNTFNGKEFYESKYDFNTGLSLSILLSVQDNIVKNITLNVHPEKQLPGIPRAWSAYSPETLIKRYGLPSDVRFFVGKGPNPSYSMDMYFDAVDLIIRYDSFDLNTQLRVCPLVDQIDYVRVWLGKDPPYPPPIDATMISLEDATSLSMEVFSKLITGDPQKACFKLKEEMFP